MSDTDNLIKQILASSNTSKWTGQGKGSAQNNAADMAKILSGIGITNIKQFGEIPVYAPVEIIGQKYNGQNVSTYQNEDGTTRQVYLDIELEELSWVGNGYHAQRGRTELGLSGGFSGAGADQQALDLFYSEPFVGTALVPGLEEVEDATGRVVG
jgi:hypothetical protein